MCVRVCVVRRLLFVDYRVFRSFELHSIFISTTLIFERSQTIKSRPERIEIKRNGTCDCMLMEKKTYSTKMRCCDEWKQEVKKGMNQIDDGANRKENCHKSQKIKVDRRITITKYVKTATKEIPLPFFALR